jgi:hypothetical protein
MNAVPNSQHDLLSKVSYAQSAVLLPSSRFQAVVWVVMLVGGVDVPYMVAVSRSNRLQAGWSSRC